MDRYWRLQMTGEKPFIKLNRPSGLLTLALSLAPSLALSLAPGLALSSASGLAFSSASGLAFSLAPILALSLALCPATNLPALAAVFNLTDADVINALEKAKILDPSIRINARVGPEEVMVATYQNPKAEDKDCKIDAVLIAKAVMDLAPGEVPRVTVYFYSASALSKYKQVEVTVSDVKAFATGSVSKDELLASIKVTAGSIVDPRARIEEHLQENASRKRAPITTTIKGEDVTVSTVLDGGLSERGVKFEAVKIAEDAFEAAPTEVKKVTIIFEDRVKRKENQVLTFSREQLKTLGDAIDTSLKELKVDLVKYESKVVAFVAGTRVNIEALELKDGPLKEERQKLVDRLKELTKAGVGYGTKVTDDLMEIEGKVGVDTEDALKEKITALSNMIAKFEENLKGAKDHKAVGGGATKPAGASASGAVPAPSVPIPYGNDASLKKMVLANPDGYINRMAADYVHISPATGLPTGKYKTADEHPNFRRNLQFAIDTLKGANRQLDAERFQKRLDEIKAKYGD
jgi:hypothetical protein